MEEIKKAGCAGTNADPGSAVAIDKLAGTRKITWPAPNQDVCLATTAKPACLPPVIIGVCVTWVDPGPVNRTLGLATYVGS